MFDTENVNRWNKSRDGTWPMDQDPHGDYVRYEDFSELSMHYNNLIHFMRRMAEQRRSAGFHDDLQQELEDYVSGDRN